MTRTNPRSGRAPAARRLLAGLPLALLAIAVSAGAGQAAVTRGPAEGAAEARAAWLLHRSDVGADQASGLPRLALAASASQDEFAPGAAAVAADEPAGGGRHGVLPVLASIVLPGSGEVLTGHKRGFALMALDIFAWTQVSKYHQRGKDKSDEYYAFADAHYTDANLLEAFLVSSADPMRDGIGTYYFPTVGTIADLSELDEKLPLYVSKEDDRREYYENLGKWDQFVFGWDDFQSPQDYAQVNPDYTPTGNAKIDLEQPWVSPNRETYRLMRDAANDAYKSRDRWLYMNIGLRLFSVVETALLSGAVGDGDQGAGDDRVSLAGHEVHLVARPLGLYRGVVAATVSF